MSAARQPYTKGGPLAVATAPKPVASNPSSRPARQTVARLFKAYSYAVVSVALATAARFALEHVFGYHHPYATFYIAVLLTAWYGGVWPGLLAIALGGIASILLVPPPPTPASQGFGNLVGFEFYFIVSFTATILFEAQRRAERRAARVGEVAQDRLEQLERETVQRELAESAAREAEERLRLTFEHAPVGIGQIALDGSLTDVNTQFCAITGFSRDELMFRSFQETTWPEDVHPGKENFAALREGKSAYFNQQVRYVRRDGIVIWVDLAVTLVRETGGRPLYAIAAIQDITSRRQAEEQLRESQKLESIGLLAGGIAHDFNNLLTAVLGNASLAIQSTTPGSAERRMLESVVRAGDRAAQLTGQLLAYAGKAFHVNRSIDLSELVRDTSELLRPSLPQNVELRLQLANGLPLFAGDPTQIQQVITNLVMNAAEASSENPQGIVAVVTDIAEFGEAGPPVPQVGQIAPGRYVMLRVRDNGCGMTPSVLRQAFDPFFSTKFLGRGLGLAAVAGIVRTAKGAVLVSSEPDRGSAFSILFSA